VKLNCKPGDMAIIIDSDPFRNPDTGGVLCDVLHHPPLGYFRFPDGTPAARAERPACSWVIRLHRPIQVRWTAGEIRTAVYAVCPDNKLRPIRDQPGADETLEWAPKIEGVTA